MITREKIVAHSDLLGRWYHCDLFKVGESPRFSVLFVGGSGVTPAEYERRAASVTPALEPSLARVQEELSFELLFVTSPADGLFARLEDEEERQRWVRHVQHELRPRLAAGPLVLMGHSGGALLALVAAAELRDCVGAGMLGADGLAQVAQWGFVDGVLWEEPLVLYYNLEDRVYQENREAIDELLEAGSAQCFHVKQGGHDLASYVANESFDGLLRRAGRLARSAGRG